MTRFPMECGARTPRWKWAFVIAATAIPVLADAATGQCIAPTPPVATTALVRIGSTSADSLRLGAVLGACWGDSRLIRSSASSPAQYAARLEVAPIRPVVESRWNSAIPVGGNDGPLWAGRGWNMAVSGGAQLRYRALRFTFSPTVTYSQNRPFPVLPSGNTDRSAFASPWHAGGMSADLPLRFGTASYTRVDPGESEADFTHRGLSVGLASSSQWWGPGVRGALVMSNNSAGIPRVYIRTAHPLVTRLGDFEGLWFLGGLVESPFFDYDTRNDLRSLSAAVVTWRVIADTGLTLGGARGVYAAARRFGRLPGHAADVFTDWHRQSAATPTTDRSDQIFSFFAWWRFPASGFSAHLEWARLMPPGSIREISVSPQAHQGYIMGIDWAGNTGLGTFRAQAEVTMLEQTPRDRVRDAPEFYASHSVPQGYTQQGQVIGAAVGPGSSSQYFGLDLFRKAWRFSSFLERSRIEETAYYRTISGIAGRAHDVSLHTGLGIAYDGGHGTWDISYTRTLRLNYLFQTVTPYFRGDQFDVLNNSVSVRFMPRIPRRRSPIAHAK